MALLAGDVAIFEMAVKRDEEVGKALATSSFLEYNNGRPPNSYRRTCSAFCARREAKRRNVLSALVEGESQEWGSSSSVFVRSSFGWERWG